MLLLVLVILIILKVNVVVVAIVLIVVVVVEGDVNGPKEARSLGALSWVNTALVITNVYIYIYSSINPSHLYSYISGCAKPAKNAAYFEGPAQDGSTIVKVKEGTKAGTQIYMIRVNNVNKPIFRMSGGGEDFVLEGPYLMLRSSLNQTRRGIYFLNIHSG